MQPEVIRAINAEDCLCLGSWNDTSQAEAYAHTLASFVSSFPEFKENDLFLTGESYAGQYVPNIAHYIVNHEPFKSSLNLKGIAVGNGCWGGSATEVIPQQHSVKRERSTESAPSMV